MTALTRKEKDVRNTLIVVCRGKRQTRFPRKINYKHLWEIHGDKRPWARAFTRQIVDWVIRISDHDIAKGLPPLNALVVRADTGMPGDNWYAWNKRTKARYKSVVDAQKACWKKWTSDK
jgi:hypothetical protein